MTLNQFLKNIILMVLCSILLFFFIITIKDKTALYTEAHSAIALLTLKSTITDSSPYQKQLTNFFSNSYIKAIILIIDSRSLSAAASYALFYEIQALKKEYPKPLITLIENECLGYAYLIASATDYIVATEASLIGNIGNKSTDEITASVHDDLYEQLVKNIATTRKLSLSTASNWAQNHVFTGKQALKLGLINITGSLSNVVQVLKEKGFIEGDIIWIENMPKNKPFLSFKVSF
jgi:ClpP class serine protease